MSPQNYPMQNPFLSIVNQASKQVRLFCAEFGLTPASRTRVAAAAPAESTGDAFENYLNGVSDQLPGGAAGAARRWMGAVAVR